MTEIGTLLAEWGFPDLVQTFQDNGINTDSFNLLTEEHIKELIPKVGPRLLFLQKYNIYKAPVVVIEEEENSTITESEDVASLTSSGELEDTSYHVEHNVGDLGLTAEEKEKTPAAVDKQRKQEECQKLIKLKDLLNDSSDGKIILSYYSSRNTLSDSLRDKLVTLIINNEIRHDLDRRISQERYETLANGIVGLFPSEVKEMYFSYSLKRNGSNSWRKVGSGKLFQKFYNQRRLLRQSGLLTNKKRKLSFSQDLSEVAEDDEILWLQNSVEPWAELVAKWKKSFDKRKLHRETLSIQEYMSLFPALKLKLGYTLMEDDFNTMYPELELKAFANFQNFANKILTFARNIQNKSIQDYLKVFDKELPRDVYNTHIMMMLPLLLKPVFVKRNKGSSSWKPSKTEVTEGFIMHVNIVADIKVQLERRRNKLANFGLTQQPLPIIVGEDLQNITASYLSIDNELYVMPTTFKAVDICFKVIHALNATYSTESEQVWLLLQKGLYELSTPFDKNFVEVEKVLKALNNSQ